MPEQPIGPQGQPRPELSLTVIQTANQTVKELNASFINLYKGLESSKSAVISYEEELQKNKKVSLKTILAFEKAQDSAREKIAQITLAREEFIANKRIELTNKGLDPKSIEESITNLRKLTSGFQDLTSHISSSFKVGLKPEKGESPFKSLVDNIKSGLGMVSKEGAKTSDILLSSLAGVASKILAAVGVFDLLRTAAQAWVAGTYLSAKASMGFSQIMGKVSNNLDELGSTALASLLGSSSEATIGIDKLTGGVNLLSEESESAVTNFNKLIGDGKVTRYDMIRSFGQVDVSQKVLNDRMLQSLLAVDAWGRGIQAFGKSSEQGAEMAGNYMKTFNLQGVKLAEAFNKISVNALQAWVSIDTFDKAVRSTGERLRLSSKDSSEALSRSALSVEKFGKFVEGSLDKVNYSGSEVNQVLDIMYNKMNGMSLSFKMAALQAGGLTEGMDVGQAAFKAFTADTNDLVAGTGAMLKRMFQGSSASADTMALAMTQMFKIPEDQAHITFPLMKKWAEDVKALGSFQGGGVERSRLAEREERSGKALKTALKEVSDTKAIEDPLKAIQKILVNMFKMMGSMMNFGVAIKSATGAMD